MMSKFDFGEPFFCPWDGRIVWLFPFWYEGHINKHIFVSTAERL